jgi:hypothetical protein
MDSDHPSEKLGLLIRCLAYIVDTTDHTRLEMTLDLSQADCITFGLGCKPGFFMKTVPVKCTIQVIENPFSSNVSVDFANNATTVIFRLARTDYTKLLTRARNARYAVVRDFVASRVPRPQNGGKPTVRAPARLKAHANANANANTNANANANAKLRLKQTPGSCKSKAGAKAGLTKKAGHSRRAP